MVDDRHVAEAEGPEEDVGAVQGEVERHRDARVVDVGREVDEVVRVHGLVDVLLQELVGGQVRALLAHPERPVISVSSRISLEKSYRGLLNSQKV